LAFFLVDFFAVFFLAVFLAAIYWLLRVRRLLNPSVATPPDADCGALRVSKVRLVRASDARRFMLLVVTCSPPCCAFNQFCRCLVKANCDEIDLPIAQHEARIEAKGVQQC